jgi:hypothetical protein
VERALQGDSAEDALAGAAADATASTSDDVAFVQANGGTL